MTIRKANARNIDNRRLLSLQIGEIFIPSLGVHVPWEGFGERAALMLVDRRPGLRQIISQPERMHLVVNGKPVTYTPDYQVSFQEPPVEVWEVRGHHQLQEEKVQSRLAAAEIEVARTGRKFRVFNSPELTSSTELRNVQLLRRYARYPVTPEQSLSVLSAYRFHEEISLGSLIDAAGQYGIRRGQLYALLYRNELAMDWNQLLCDSSVIRPGAAHRALVLAKDFFKHRQKPDRPAVDCGMAYNDSTFLHYFLQVAIAQRIRRVPTDANQNDVDWKRIPLVASIAFQAFSVKVLSIDEQAA